MDRFIELKVLLLNILYSLRKSSFYQIPKVCGQASIKITSDKFQPLRLKSKNVYPWVECLTFKMGRAIRPENFK